MSFDPAGFPFVGIIVGLAAVAWRGGFPIVALAFGVLACLIGLFFRDPPRRAPAEPGVLVAPADGRVLRAGVAAPTEAPPGRWLQVSIFLSPLDVHINRIPIAGEITRVDHMPGRFLPAYRSGAGTQNERNEVWLDHDGDTIMFRQVVGALARRVVCRVTKGTRVQTGQRFGIMKFGSRMDLFVPTHVILEVTEGDRVRGGETIVARYH